MDFVYVASLKGDCCQRIVEVTALDEDDAYEKIESLQYKDEKLMWMMPYEAAKSIGFI